MQKLLALMAVLTGAASAYAAEPHKWYSNGFDNPATLTLGDDNERGEPGSIFAPHLGAYDQAGFYFGLGHAKPPSRRQRRNGDRRGGD
jgi:hypothetical protein